MSDLPPDVQQAALDAINTRLDADLASVESDVVVAGRHARRVRFRAGTRTVELTIIAVNGTWRLCVDAAPAAAAIVLTRHDGSQLVAHEQTGDGSTPWVIDGVLAGPVRLLLTYAEVAGGSATELQTEWIGLP